MKELEILLVELFKKSIELNQHEYTNEQIENKWIGNPATNLKEIKIIERKLDIKFPIEYINILLITNGFSTSSIEVEPSFIPIQKVDYLKNIFPEILDIWTENNSDNQFEEKLQRSILIAGINEEQQFLLIPPVNESSKWEYWKFANWIPGEEAYTSITEYINNVIEFINYEIED